MNKLGLYIHIPFCETKCPYCDFNTYSGIENLIPEYMDALNKEIRFWGSSLQGNYLVDTIFLGGGTPSYLPSNQLMTINQNLMNSFCFDDDLEFTMEVNPGDIIASSAINTKNTKINRLSLGVQSLDDSLLKVLGRRHSSDDACDAFKIARKSGFNNLSIDLIYGIPYQSMAQWEQTLKRSLELQPEHISAYCLTLEEGTPMHYQVGVGRLPEPDPDLAADMYLTADAILKEAGYSNYEISNWAQLGMESRHNLRYWLNDDYIGVGPGAHSHLEHFRFHNLKSPRQYIQTLKELNDTTINLDNISDSLDELPFIGGYEHIDKSTKIVESIMLGLRLGKGINKLKFKEQFGKEIQDIFPSQLSDLTSSFLIEDTGEYLKLNSDAKLLANEVIVRFLE